MSEPIESLSLASSRIEAGADQWRRVWRLPRASTLIEVVQAPADVAGDVPAIFFSTDGRTCTRAGCEFVRLPEYHLTAIQRYVIELRRTLQ